MSKCSKKHFHKQVASSSIQNYQIRPKVLRRFYEPLLLLDSLGRVRGESLKKSINPEDESFRTFKHQRSFADALAYICAYRKEPEYVTATALESTPEGVRIWLAANQSVEQVVIQFLLGTLQRVESVIHQSNELLRKQAFVRELDGATKDVLIFNAPRNLVYWKMIKFRRLEPCRQAIEEYGRRVDLQRGESLLLLFPLS